jgi:hypothetical protein
MLSLVLLYKSVHENEHFSLIIDGIRWQCREPMKDSSLITEE